MAGIKGRWGFDGFLKALKYDDKNELVKGKLRWADEYFAVSVSESMIQTVRKYIYKQEEHHQKVKFEEEYEKFMQRYGFREKDTKE